MDGPPPENPAVLESGAVTSVSRHLRVRGSKLTTSHLLLRLLPGPRLLLRRRHLRLPRAPRIPCSPAKRLSLHPPLLLWWT